jgi:hypothetical protein
MAAVAAAAVVTFRMRASPVEAGSHHAAPDDVDHGVTMLSRR